MNLLAGAVGPEVASRKGAWIMSTRTSAVVRAGDRAPDFTLRSLAGEAVSLSDYRGRKVVLFMWASW